MKNRFITLATLLMAICHLVNAQDTKGTFFGPISCGDNLEKCIQNGWVQHTGGATAWLSYDWKLTDSDITSRFPRAGVVFDSRNIIQEKDNSHTSAQISHTAKINFGCMGGMVSLQNSDCSICR